MIYIFILLIFYINYSSATTIDNNSSDPDDATWVLSSAFVIITMQSGFGLLESGMVSDKNQINIMMKNIADVVFGGFSFWLFGYGFSFGDSKYSNSFVGSSIIRKSLLPNSD